MHALSVALLAVACGDRSRETGLVYVDLTCPQVATLGTAEVGVGNVSYREPNDDGGGPRAAFITLSPKPADGGSQIHLAVAEGQTFEVGGARWQVVTIRSGWRGDGATVRRLP